MIVQAYTETFKQLLKKLKNIDVSALDDNEIDDTSPRSCMDIDYVLEKPDLNVKVLTKYPMKDKIRSFNYLWHIISIAIFYSIPVVQLVMAYQRVSRDKKCL